MDHVLLRYRSNPTNRNFREVHQRCSPWVKACAARTLRRFSALSYEGHFDDLANEGMWSIERSARRYVFVCSECDRVFLSGSRLREHAMDEHCLRGNCAKVSIATYSKYFADLTIRGCVRKAFTPEILYEEVLSGELDFPEVRILTKLYLEQVRRKLSRESLLLLGRILNSDRPRRCGSKLVDELRSNLSYLIEV